MRLPTFYEQNLIPNWGIFLYFISKLYISLNSKLQTSDFKLQTSDFKLQTSDFKLQTSDFRPQTSDFSPQTSSIRLFLFALAVSCDPRRN